MHRRSYINKYRYSGTYLITITVQGRKPLLGVVVGDPHIAYGEPGAPCVEYSPLGHAIIQDELPKISQHYPSVDVWKVCIMPDHIHLIIHVNGGIEKGQHIGKVIAGFKAGCSHAWWKISPESKNQSLFEQGYNDRILHKENQFENWKQYLDDNPRRLLLKRENPGLFTVMHNIDIAGDQCQAVGNMFLLNIPQKEAVIVHRRYTDDEVMSLRKQWMACGKNGGVLVSAAIAPKEKEVLHEAFEKGYNIILLREKGFPPLYKPSGRAFDSCSAGRLLQISPWEYSSRTTTITREQCLHLNSIVTKIAED